MTKNNDNTKNTKNTDNTLNNQNPKSPFQNINPHNRTAPTPDIAATLLRERMEVVLESITPENLPSLLVCVDKNGVHTSVHGTAADLMSALCVTIGTVSQTFSEMEFQILKEALQNDFCWEMIKNIRANARKERGLSDDE